MEHLTSGVRRFLGNNRKAHKYEINIFKDGVIRMSDLNTSFTDSIKNCHATRVLNNTAHNELNELDLQIFLHDSNMLNNSHHTINDTQSITVQTRNNKEVIQIDNFPKDSPDEHSLIKVKIVMKKAPVLNIVNDFSKTKTSNEVENIDSKVISKSKSYQPIMGKNALLAKMNTEQPVRAENKSDSEIIQELVTNRFSNFLQNYYQRSLSRQNSRVNRDYFEYERDSNTYIKSDSSPVDSLNSLSSMLDSIVRESSSTSIDDFEYQSGSQTFESANYSTSTSDSDAKLRRSLPSLGEFNNFKLSNIGSLESGLDFDFLKSTDENNIETSSEILNNSTNELGDHTVSYDAHTFLKEALGDELNAYVSTDSQVVSDVDYAENYSIGTSNISALVSKGSSYVCDVSQRNDMRPSSTIYEENAYSECSEHYAAQTVSDLIIESNIQKQIMLQTSKALGVCRQIKEFVAGMEEIEAERILLVATLKCDALKEEIHKLEYDDLSETDSRSHGCVKIKKMTFLPKPKPPVPTPFDKRKKEFSTWYVCALRCGPLVQATKSALPKEDGTLQFEEEFTFKNLKTDFEIDVGVYGIKIRNNLRNYSHESKFHLNKDFNNLCPSPHKFFTLSREKHMKITEDASRKTSFQLSGRCTFNIGNIKDLGYFKLRDLPLCSPFEGTVVIKFHTEVTLAELHSDFLNVGSDSNGSIIWNRKWCVLQGSKLFYYNYPGDERPVGCLDLCQCVTSVITAADRQICARPRTIFLETQQSGQEVVEHFLAADTAQSFKVWEKSLNLTVSTLRNWNCLV